MEKIKRHLNQYGMALDLKTTFDEMLIELEMTKEYIKAVRISLLAKTFPEMKIM